MITELIFHSKSYAFLLVSVAIHLVNFFYRNPSKENIWRTIYNAWYIWHRQKCTICGRNYTVVLATFHSKIWCTILKHNRTLFTFYTNDIDQTYVKTRSSADADNRLDAFSGQSRSTNMVPFHKYTSILEFNVPLDTV